MVGKKGETKTNRKTQGLGRALGMGTLHPRERVYEGVRSVFEDRAFRFLKARGPGQDGPGGPTVIHMRCQYLPSGRNNEKDPGPSPGSLVIAIRRGSSTRNCVPGVPDKTVATGVRRRLVG